MDTSQMTFCAFSPLRTPDVKLVKKRKKVKKIPTVDQLRSTEIDSDLESVVSVVTKDIRNIVQSVNSKLTQQQQQSDSEVDLLPKKVKANMPGKTMSDDSTDLNSSSESDFDGGMKSPSKKRKLDNTNSNNTSPRKKVKFPNGKKKGIVSDSSESGADSDVSSLLLKSPKKAVIKDRRKVKKTSHEISESGESDFDDFEEKTKVKKKVESPRKKVIESPKKKIVESTIKKAAVSESSDMESSDSEIEEKQRRESEKNKSDTKTDNDKSTKEGKDSRHKTLALPKKKVITSESSDTNNSDSDVQVKETHKMNKSKIGKYKGAKESKKEATKTTVSPKKSPKEKAIVSDISDTDISDSDDDSKDNEKEKSPVKKGRGKSPLKETDKKNVDGGSNSDSDSRSTGLDSDSNDDDDVTEKGNGSRKSKSKGASSSKSGKGKMSDVNSDSDRSDSYKSGSEKSYSFKSGSDKGDSEKSGSDKSDSDKSIDSDKSDSDVSASEDEHEARSPKKSTSSKQMSSKSASTSFSTPRPSVSNSKTGGKNMRFQIPEKFYKETAVTNDCLTSSDIKGKKLWLIQAPRELDISTLKGRKINMSGSSVISSREEDSEKQYEVSVRQFYSDVTDGYQTLTAIDNKQLSIGLGLHGQISISNWIPTMPPVEINKPEKHKHIVPDNLSSSFQLFGSDSPPHSPVKYDQQESTKKSKKSKKHKKRMSELANEALVSQDDTMVTSSMEEVSSAKKKKKKKHKRQHE